MAKEGDPITLIGAKKDKDIRWKKIPCKCDHSDVEKEFPIFECLHCKFQSYEDGLPKKCYKKNFKKTDDNGKQIDVVYLVSKVEIVRGKKYDEVAAYLSYMEKE